MSVGISALLRNTKNPIPVCVTFALLWIAAADGKVDEEELAFITAATEKASSTANIKAMLELIEARDLPSMLLACQLLRDNLSTEERKSFLSLLITVAVIDRRLAISENHILRFFADLLRFSPADFFNLYQEIVGTSLPDAGDPSSITWWESRIGSGPRQEEKRNKKRNHRQEKAGRQQRNGESISRSEAFVVLGLRPDASADDITRAYRRLAQSHHPDRYAELGLEAEQVAKAMFQRIRSAYEVLK